MSKPGVMQLPTKLFPDLQDKYTAEELKHMLIICGLDVNGSGLMIFQTVPDLLKSNGVITKQEVSKLLYPIVVNAMEKEFVHAKLICLLNNSSGEQKLDYCITTVFIGDAKNSNLKLADVFLGEHSSGSWANEEQVKQFSDSLGIPVYLRK